MPFQRAITVKGSTDIGVQNGTLSIVPGTDIPNFPMRFAGVYPFLATVANGGKVQSNTGLDIFFTLDAAGSNRLNFEKVAYNPVTGAVEFYVQIPMLFGALGSAIDTTFYLWYGQNNTANISNRNGTWTSDYSAVYHFGDGTTLDLTDSTSNHNDGINNNGVAAAPGLLGDNTSNFTGGSAKFVAAASQNVDCGGAASIQITGTPGIVLIVILQVSSVTAAIERGIVGNGTGIDTFGPGYLIYQNRNVGGSANALGFVNSAEFTFFSDNIGNLATHGAILFYGAQAANGNKLSGNSFDAFNGLTSTGGGVITPANLVAGGHLLIGGGNGGGGFQFFDGLIDEVRILNTPANYPFNLILNTVPRLITEINNLFQNVNFPFYHVGAESAIAALAGQCNNPPEGVVGTPYTAIFNASGGAPPYSFAITAGSLPAGLSLASNGIVTGTPTTGGLSNFTVTVTDNNQATASFNCSISVIAITPGTNPALTIVGGGGNPAVTKDQRGGCRPLNYFDLCLLREIRRWKRIHPLHVCSVPPELWTILPWEDEFLSLPAEAIPFKKIQSIVTPAPAAGDQVVSQLVVPQGYDGIVAGVFWHYNGTGFIEGSGDILWRIQVNMRFVKDLSNVPFSLGSSVTPLPMTDGQLLQSRQAVSIVVNVPNGSGLIQVGASDIIGGLFGFFWPKGGVPGWTSR